MALTGKRAIITGSTSGIGLGVAEALAAAGAEVVLNSFTDRPEDHDLARDLGARHGVTSRYIAADMSKGADCRALIEKAGGCDILVNNAGIQFVSPVEDFPVDKWDAILAINLSLPHHRRRLAGHEGEWLGTDRQHRKRPWPDRQSVQVGLCRGKARDRGPVQDRGA